MKICYVIIHLYLKQVTDLIVSYRQDMPDVAWLFHVTTFFMIAATDDVSNAIKSASNDMNVLH